MDYIYDETYAITGWFDAVLVATGWFDTGLSESQVEETPELVVGARSLMGVGI